MAKSRKTLDNTQLNIFDLIRQVSERQKVVTGRHEVPGELNIDVPLREMISEALKGTRLSRYQVAAEMSRMLGREITKAQLDSWSAESKENHRFPLVYFLAFMEATGDKTILRFICEKAGGYFIEGEDALRLELGRIEEQKRELQKKERAIRGFLGSLK